MQDRLDENATVAFRRRVIIGNVPKIRKRNEEDYLTKELPYIRESVTSVDAMCNNP